MRNAINSFGVFVVFILSAFAVLRASDTIGLHLMTEVGAVILGVFLIILFSVILFVTIAALIHFTWTYFLKVGRRMRRV